MPARAGTGLQPGVMLVGNKFKLQCESWTGRRLERLCAF